MNRFVLSCVLMSGASIALAQSTPVGLWKTFDDSTGKARSLVRITEEDGVLTGRIEKGLGPNDRDDSVCDKCTDERKGAPLYKFALIRNVRRNATDKEIYDGGDITDPDNGKVYRVTLKPFDDGNKLRVRGYFGPFFRTQVWQREQ